MNGFSVEGENLPCPGCGRTEAAEAWRRLRAERDKLSGLLREGVENGYIERPRYGAAMGQSIENTMRFDWSDRLWRTARRYAAASMTESSG